MKIGILTLPLTSNYGGILQAYAMQTILERMGNEVDIIEQIYPKQLPLWRMPLSYCKRILKNLTGHPFPIFYEQKLKKDLPVIRQNTDKFICKYIQRRRVNNFSDLKENDFDAIIVGSDQVWRPKYFCGMYSTIENAYLAFTEGWNIKRISYSASFGTDQWEYTERQTNECGRLIRKFDAVSVREDSGVDLCYRYFNINTVQVLDPTMLLDSEDYVNLFKMVETPKSRGTLLCYILDETPGKTTFVNSIAIKHGLVPFRVNSTVENINARLDERIQPPVEKWLRGFYDAEYVVTDSFHACVFSILFNKPFMAIGNASRGISRFTSLLKMFNLENRLTTSDSPHLIESAIDWENVNILRQSMKKYSMEFLTNALRQSYE